MKIYLIEKLKEIVKEVKNIRELYLKDKASRSNEAAENLKKNFQVKKEKKKVSSNDFISSKMQSMKDSQGMDDFSGSSYKGPGNVDHEKTNSNASHRNF